MDKWGQQCFWNVDYEEKQTAWGAVVSRNLVFGLNRVITEPA